METGSLDIVMFLSTGDWEVNTRQRMIVALAKALEEKPHIGRILCVERPVCPISTALLHRHKYFEWLHGKRGFRQLETNLFLFTPFVLLHDSVAPKIPLVTRLNRMFLRRTLGHVLVRLGFQLGQLITWVFHPYQLYCAGLLHERLLIYECYDEYSEFANVRAHLTRAQMIREYERIMLQRADVVLVTAEGLFQSRKEINPHTFFVPNGVDFDHFNTPVRHCDIPEEFHNIQRPIIGFVGTINEKIDYKLIEYLARTHPDWSIVMIGRFTGQPSLRTQKDFLRVSSYLNVHFLGGRAYNVIPRYVRSFDVCLIPLAIDRQTEKAYPLKLHEYLATGKPVVSTALPEVEQFKGVVRIGRNYSEFEHAVAQSLPETDENLRKQRIAISRENTWANRAESVLSIIADALRGRM